MRKKEIILGFLFAIVVTIFINYVTIERVSAMRYEAADVFNQEWMIRHLYFPIAWYMFVSMFVYVYFNYSFRLLDKNINKYITLLIITLGAIVLPYVLAEFEPVVKDIIFPDQTPPQDRRLRQFMRGEMNVMISKHHLTAVLNLLFVYLLRLSYLNQEIRIRNEHLQLEKIKAEHNALIQQINPHFFFNSLNGLSYFISTSQTDEALSYLDNLTTVFRKILKNSDKDIYSLEEEVAFIKSYVYMLQKRFGGKIFFEFNIDIAYNDYQLPRLALLPLIENIVKHNVISSDPIVQVRIYTTDDSHIFVENNIVPRLESVESTGIGLSNLNEQYRLLFGKPIRTSSEGGIFRVGLPIVADSHNS
ncbi:MAG: histidine kinase [Rikenellaceae bacterium]